MPLIEGLFVHPVWLYLGLALGAVGVAWSMPRRTLGPRGLGGLIAAVGAGLVLLGLLLRNAPDHPNLFFYVFGFLSLAASLRVITHPRPVYAALFFIMTILSTAGLFLLLAAEFLTFALIIIYAGAILITYLFVIMLASQPPSGEAMDQLSDYDSEARAPISATILGFLLLGALTGLLNTGLDEVRRPPEDFQRNAILAELPQKVRRALVERGIPEELSFVPTEESPSGVPRADDAPLMAQLPGEVGRAFAERYRAAMAVRRGEAPPEGVTPLPEEVLDLFMDPRIGPMLDPRPGNVEPEDWPDQWTIVLERPEGLKGENIERVGYALLAGHPLALELAGVILLLAMVGAVVLARKQIELDEEAKLEAAERTGGAA